MEQEIDKNKELGTRIAYAIAGLDPDEIDVHKSAAELAAAHDAVKVSVCKLAAEMYAAAEKTDRPEFYVFKKLAKVREWPEPLDTFYDSALVGLGTTIIRAGQEESFRQKQAGARLLPGFLPGIISKGVAATPSMLATLAGLGAGVGAAGGALTWKLNRDSDKDEADLEAMKERIKYYNEITDDISEDLREKGEISDEDLDQYEQQN